MTLLAERPRTAAEFPRRGEVRIRSVAPRLIIAVDGRGKPGGEGFQAAFGALYGVAYAVHFILKRRGVEARVGALEGLWSAAPGAETRDDAPYLPKRPEDWQWTLLLELPEETTDDELADAIEETGRKRPSAAIDDLIVRELDEGDVVEALHVGPYATEPETIAKMAAAAADAGLALLGPHHEIYLGDPRRSAPERLRTVLRLPLRPCAETAAVADDRT